MSSDETQSLLAQEDADVRDRADSRSERRSSPNPLPKLQLAVIFAIKLVIPIVSTQVLPYINILVADLASADGAETGYYSGLVGSASSAAHVLTIYLWGRLSDTYGRKPVIGLGTAFMAIFTILFGLSKSFFTVLTTRFIIGLFSATTGAIHSVVGELVDPSNEAIVFPIYDIVSAVGFIIGPLIGGTFSNPATEFPAWFDTPFWREYPYFLPCLVTTSIALVALVLIIFVLEETLPGLHCEPKAALNSYSDIESIASTHEEADHEASKPLSVRGLLSIPVIRTLCASSGALAFVAGCFNTVFVLQAYTPVEHGGLALSPAQIGKALSIMGTVSIFLKLSMPVLLRRLGVLTVFRYCMRSWPVTFATMSVLSTIAKLIYPTEGTAGEWLAVSSVLFLSRIGCMAFSIIMILTKDHTPGSSSLGASNGLAEFAQSVAGVFSSPFVSSIFAFSASHQVFGGHLWVIVLVVVTLISGTFAEQMRKYRSD